MAALSAAQIEQYAYAAGFRGSALQMITAIALAESGGNPSAYNPERAAGTRPGMGSYGLTQIYLTAHPQYDPSKLSDPQYNLQAAYQVYAAAGNRFTPWSTYNNGSASRYLGSVPNSSQAAGGQYSSAMTSLTGGALGGYLPQAAGVTLAPALSPVALAQLASGRAGSGPAQAPAPSFLGIQFPSFWQFLGTDPTSFGFALGGFVMISIGVILLFVVIGQASAPVINQTVETGKKTVETAKKVAEGAAMVAAL